MIGQCLRILALSTLTASAAHAFDPAGCPAFLGLDDGNFLFHGLLVPVGPTNYPIVNAGVHYLKSDKTEQYLLDALEAICRKPVGPIDCDLPLNQGRLKDAPAASVELDLWSSVGLTAPESQLTGCRQYVALSKSLADALLPGGVALQSNPYSTEGISLRVTFSKLLALRPAVEARCQGGGGGQQRPSTGQCGSLGQFFDDLRFALMLADKLSADNKAVKALKLLTETRAVVSRLSLVAGDPSPENFNGLLGIDWVNLRSAIQLALQ